MDLFGSPAPDDVGDPGVPEPGRTPPPARAPRTSGRIDLDDWDTAGTRSAPRRWLLVAAVVPWVVVLAVIVGGDREEVGADPAPAPASAAPTPRATTSGSGDPTAAPAPAPPSPTDAAPGRTDGAVIALGGQTGPSARGKAEGLAAVVARAWLSTRPAGPTVEGLDPTPGADRRYVEHLVVESVDHPARGALVVALRAIVLPVEGDSYGAAHQLRLAVPIALDADDVRLAGRPWLLPTPDLVVDEPVGTPLDDVDLMVAAAEAISAAGYRDVDLQALERTSGWAWIARVRGRAPGQPDPQDHTIWLRSDVGRLVVAGTTPGAPGTPPSADTPPSASPSSEEVAP